MLSKESINYSLRNLKKNKTRSFLTILSIMIGITTIFIFISFGLGLFNYINELSEGSAADKVVIQPKTAGGFVTTESININDTDIDTIKRTPGVQEATGIYFKAAEAKQDDAIKYIFLVSYDPKLPYAIESYDVDIEEGRLLKNGDINKALLGYNYKIPNKVFPKPYNVNNKIEVNGIDLRVEGTLGEVGNPQDDSNIYITNDQYLELFPNTTSYNQIFAKVETKDINKVVENIENSLRRERDLEKGKEDFTVQSFNDLIDSFSTALNIVVGFIILIASISIIVSTINTANTMITSVLERYKEIGILKAVGAKNSEIFSIFLFESSFLGFMAGCLGCLLGFIISYIAGLILSNLGWGFLQPIFPAYLFIGLIVFATLTGGISGVIPAVRASKIKPVDSLREE